MGANREILMKFITQQNEKVKQDISMQGYKDDSPYRNNPSNTIYGTPQGTAITMQGVSTPLVGMDEFGNRQEMQPEQEYQFPGSRVVETPMAQRGLEVPKRRGVRLNYDDKGNVVSESTHKMATETDGKGNWFSFPTLFQNSIPYEDDSENWVDMSDRPWEEAYQEAKRRDEVIEFGNDKEAAINFGKGSWKPKKKLGGALLDKTIKCSNCGWSWKAADGGNDVSTCHKCGNENVIMQEGGQKKPIYVESENDPRYTAYQDSLSAYNLGNIKIKEYNQAIKKGKEKGTPLKVIPRNSPFTPYPGTNILPIAAGLASPTGTQYGPEGSDVSLWTSYSKWKKPQQKVIVKPFVPTQPWVDPKTGIRYTEKPIEQNIPQKRNPVKAIQNNLKPEGLIQSDIELSADMSGLRPVARIPKYYDVEDVVNNGKSQTNYRWYPKNNESLRELSEEEGDKRIMVPRYQTGGQNMYTISGNPIVIPTEGSYPLSYQYLPDNMQPIKVPRKDINGIAIPTNVLRENQKEYNRQRMVQPEYGYLNRMFDWMEENNATEKDWLKKLKKEEKANSKYYQQEGTCDPNFSSTSCPISKEAAKEEKKQWSERRYGGSWFGNADEMSVSNKYQKAGTVKYGTPEYTEAYNKGEVITDEGVRSPILLDEVVVKGKRKPKGFWEQSRDKYLKDNKDAGLLGAIGSVVTYPLSLGQHALTYGIEGKVQDPDEAWGYNTDEGWFDGAGAFGRNLVDASLNLGLDPANLAGAGILTKEKALSKLASLNNFTRRPRNINIDNVANTADNLTTDDLFDIAIERSSNDGQFLFDPTIDPLDNPDVIDLMQQSDNISAMPVEKGSKLKKFINKPFLPYDKQVLPENLEFKIKNDGRSNIKIEMIDPKTKDVHAFLDLNYHDDEWLSPSYIEVKNKLQGKQVQDLLYQKGIEEAQKNGFKGVRSGDHLLSPDKTLKSHGRFERVALQPDASTRNPDIPISGLTKHTNPNLYNEFFEVYKKLPKHVQGKYSVNDLYKMYTNHLMKNKDEYIVGALGIPTLGAMADVAIIPSFGEGYESRILKWLHEQDNYQNPYDNSTDVTKYQIGGTSKDGNQLQKFQFAGLALNDPLRKEYAKRVVQEAERRIRDRDYITSEEVPQNVKEASAREGKLPYTCIGGACDVYKTAGVLNNINWSNTDFALHAKDYGFTANQGWGLKGIDNLEPGDMIQYKQYSNEQGKYYPSHSRIFLGIDANGKYRFFDNQAGGEQVFDRSELEYWLDFQKKDTEPNAVIFKVNPYNNDNPLGLTPKEKEVYDNKQDMIKKDSTSKSSYKWSISPTAKDYNENTKRVMDKFLNFANDNDKINDLVKKTGKSKEEIQDSLLNVFGELGAENNWTTSRGKGLGSLAENVAESILTAVGGGKSYSVGPGQIKYSELQREEESAKLAGTKSLKEQFNITSPNDLYDVDKVLPLMTAMDLRDKQVLENWGKNNTLERKLFGVENYDDPFTIEDLPARNNSDSRLDDVVGRYSPYLRTQYSSIASGTTLEGDDDWKPFNERVEPNYVPSEYYNQPGTMRVKYERDPGSYPDVVEQNWRENLNRVMTRNADGAIELDEVVIPNKQTGGLTKYQTKGEVVPVKKWMGNTLTPEGYITSTTKGGNTISFTGNQRADEWINKQVDSGKFGFDPQTGATFPLKKPVKGLSKEDQFIGSEAYYDLQAPDGFNSESQLAQIKKLPQFQQDIINAENIKRRKRGVSNNMQEVAKSPLFYAPGAIATGGLGILGLEAAGAAAAPYITTALATQLPGMAAVPGATVGNAITAGFAGHGLTNIAPDTVEMYENPTWSNAGSLAMDALEIAPIVGPAGKTIGEGMTAAGRALGTEEGLLSNTWKLNPKAYQYNLPENTMWRGLGKEGMEDAVSSGLFRSKQNVEGVKIPNTNFVLSKSFGINPYFTPKFKTAATYGDNFLAEVPRDAANWRNRYGSNTWSQIADRPIPIDEGRILQKDWLQGYKPIEVPKQLPGSPNAASSVDDVVVKLESQIANLKQEEALAEESRKALYADYKAGKITADEYSTGAKKLNPHGFDNPRYELEQQLKDHKIKQEIANTPQQNILKSEEQLGKNISVGGISNKGVFELGDDYVARLSAHGYDDASLLVKYADKIKSPRIAKTLQIKEIDGKVYQVQNKVTGTPVERLTKDELQNIPEEHINNLFKDKAELEELGLYMDFDNANSNMLYDPKKGFQLFDLGIGERASSNQVLVDTYEGLRLPESSEGVMSNSSRLNLERTTPKVKKKMKPEWQEVDLGNGLIEQTPFRKGLNDNVVKRIKIKDKGSISLKHYKDADGKTVYFFSADVAEGGLNAGKAFKQLEKFIPKGSKILEQKSLSTDSFYNVLRRAKNPKQFTWVDEGTYIPLNSSGINRAFSNADKAFPNSMDLKFESFNEARKALNELNSRITIEGIPKAKLSKIVDEVQLIENGPWVKQTRFGIDIPNIGLIKEYKKGGQLDFQKYAMKEMGGMMYANKDAGLPHEQSMGKYLSAQNNLLDFMKRIKVVGGPVPFDEYYRENIINPRNKS